MAYAHDLGIDIVDEDKAKETNEKMKQSLISNMEYTSAYLYTRQWVNPLAHDLQD